MTKDETLKLALEALEEAWYHVGTFQPTEKAIDLYDEARTAIKEALAQPEQEPVAVRYDYDGYGYQYIDSGSGSDWQTRVQGEPLYTTPPQRTERPVDCERCNRLEEQAYDLVGKLRVANIKLSMQPQRTCEGCGKVAKP